MENLWSLRLYCDEKADDSFTILLEAGLRPELKYKRLYAPEGCTLIFESDEFETLTFDLIGASGKRTFSYLITLSEMKSVSSLSPTFTKKRSRTSDSGPTLEFMIAYHKQLGVRIKDIIIKYRENDLELSTFN